MDILEKIYILTEEAAIATHANEYQPNDDARHTKSRFDRRGIARVCTRHTRKYATRGREQRTVATLGALHFYSGRSPEPVRQSRGKFTNVISRKSGLYLRLPVLTRLSHGRHSALFVLGRCGLHANALC